MGFIDSEKHLTAKCSELALIWGETYFVGPKYLIKSNIILHKKNKKVSWEIMVITD